MKLTFYGRLSETVGARVIERSPPATVADSGSLRQWLGMEFPDLLDPRVRIALDDVMVSGPAPIAGVREAAFLPPVSGG